MLAVAQDLGSVNNELSLMLKKLICIFIPADSQRQFHSRIIR